MDEKPRWWRIEVEPRIEKIRKLEERNEYLAQHLKGCASRAEALDSEKELYQSFIYECGLMERFGQWYDSKKVKKDG